MLIRQFTNDEDDLFDTLNNSLNRDDVGQTPLEEQLNLDPGLVRPDLQGYLEADDGVPAQRGYEYGEYCPWAFEGTHARTVVIRGDMNLKALLVQLQSNRAWASSCRTLVKGMSLPAYLGGSQ